MALSGNRLGPRVRVQYVSDAGVTYILTTDADLVVTGSGLEIGNTGVPAPRRFSPRGVHAQAIDAGKIYRKFFVCGENDAPLYVSNTSTAVTTDGLAFNTTGRRGERQTF